MDRKLRTREGLGWLSWDQPSHGKDLGRKSLVWFCSPLLWGHLVSECYVWVRVIYSGVRRKCKEGNLLKKHRRPWDRNLKKAARFLLGQLRGCTSSCPAFLPIPGSHESERTQHLARRASHRRTFCFILVLALTPCSSPQVHPFMTL